MSLLTAPGLLHRRRVRLGSLLYRSAVVQIAGNGNGHTVARFQPLSDFKTSPMFVFGLAGRANLSLRDAIAVQQKHLVNAVTVIHRTLGKKDGFLFFLAGYGCLCEKTRLQPTVHMRDPSLC